MATVTTEYTPIDSLSIILIGNASAQLKIHFDAELITLTSLKKTIASQNSWATFLLEIIELIK